MQQFPKTEHRHDLSKVRRFRKVLNRMPFYHRITRGLFNERLLQSKSYNTFYFVPPDLPIIRFGNIVYFKDGMTSGDLVTLQYKLTSLIGVQIMGYW